MKQNDLAKTAMLGSILIAASSKRLLVPWSRLAFENRLCPIVTATRLLSLNLGIEYAHGMAAAALSPNGQRACTCAEWHCPQLWSLDEPSEGIYLELECEKWHYMHALPYWSPDSRLLAITCGNKLTMFEAGSGKRLWMRSDDTYCYTSRGALSWSPDSKKLACIEPGLRSLVICDGRTGEVIARPVISFAGRVALVKTVMDLGRLALYLSSETNHWNSLNEDSDDIEFQAVAWSPDGSMLLTHAGDPLLLDTNDWRVHRIMLASGMVGSLWSPDSRYIVGDSKGVDKITLLGSLDVIEVPTGRLVQRWITPGHNALWSPSGDYLGIYRTLRAQPESGALYIYHMPGGEPVYRVAGRRCLDIRWVNSDTEVLGVDSDGSIWQWELPLPEHSTLNT